MQRGRAYSRGTNPWKITPSPLKAKRHGFNHDAFALKNPVGEPYSGTDPKRLWLLRSRPDQVHRRTMRRGPPAEILAELRFARLLESRLAGPEGRYVGPLPGPPPEGEGGGLRFAGPGGSLRFALLLLDLLGTWGLRFAGPGGSLRFALLLLDLLGTWGLRFAGPGGSLRFIALRWVDCFFLPGIYIVRSIQARARGK